MGKKKDRKCSGAGGQGATAKAAKGFNPWIAGAIVVAVVGVGALVLSGRTDEAATPARDRRPPEADRARSPRAAATAKLGPHKQASLPPIPFQGYAPPRSPEVVTAAYQFAAEHPEILSYVPCFCGCEQRGHSGNDDCFVKSRAANGDVHRVGRARRRLRRLHRRRDPLAPDARVGRLGRATSARRSTRSSAPNARADARRRRRKPPAPARTARTEPSSRR